MLQIPMRAQGRLDVVHIDVCVPFDIILLGVNIKFIYFMDTFIRMIRVYVITTKYEVLPIFKKFKVMIENKQKYNSKLYGVTELVSTVPHNLNPFCEKIEIQHEIKTLYTSRHNGLLKRETRPL